MKFVFSFISGATLAALITFYALSTSYETGYDLMSSVIQAATLDRDVRFLTLSDSELRCTLAKYVASSSEELKNTEISDIYIYGAPGLQEFTDEQISRAIEFYESKPEIKELATSCATVTKIY